MEGYVGRLALVTGAGDGIGAMLARRLAAEGMRVCVADIRAEAARRVAEAIGPAAQPLVFDVSDREACVGAAQQLKAEQGELAVLWANAGVGVGAGLLRCSADTANWAFGVNVLGLLWTAQAFVPLMVAVDGPCHFGVTASTASLRPPEGDFPLYATTKHGTLAIAEGLRGELQPLGIDSTILCPGLLSTQIWDGAKARPSRYGGPKRMDAAVGERWSAAQRPEVLWPAIRRCIAGGGGYLVCDTEATGIEDVVRRHADALAAAVVRY
ncbi:MAG: SDR family oxidoreductase [Pseudomonadota bacterium]